MLIVQLPVKEAKATWHHETRDLPTLPNIILRVLNETERNVYASTHTLGTCECFEFLIFLIDAYEF